MNLHISCFVENLPLMCFVFISVPVMKICYQNI